MMCRWRRYLCRRQYMKASGSAEEISSKPDAEMWPKVTKLQNEWKEIVEAKTLSSSPPLFEKENELFPDSYQWLSLNVLFLEWYNLRKINDSNVWQHLTF